VGGQAPEPGELVFVGLPHQLRFQQHVYGPQSTRNTAFIGAAGTGKTRSVVMAALAMSAIDVGLPGVITEPTYGMVTDILEPTIEEVCDEYEIPRRYRAREHRFFFPWWGSSILCRSGEKPRRLRGPNLAWAGMDEATDQPEEVFTTLQGRVRHPKAPMKRLFLGGTPRGFNWTWELFHDDGTRRLPDSSFLTAKASDNTYVTEADPNWIPSMAASYDPQLYQQEVDGVFLAIGQGQTYHQFSSANVTRVDVDPDLPLILTCDFNIVPMAWIVLQCQGRGHPIRVVDEISVGPDTDTACSEYLERWGDHPAGLLAVYGDASGHSGTTKGNRSDYEIIRDRLRAQIRVRYSNPAVRDRHNAVNAKLRNARGDVGLLIDEKRCPRLAGDLRKARNLPNSLQPDKDFHDPHFADALGYYVFAEHFIQVARRSA
jgi:hypothetical protein